MTDTKSKVVVIPCSGIGKSLGTVSREAAYELCENLRPATTDLVALSKLVLGDAEAQERVRTSPAVTIDGCRLMCASKLVRESGGTIACEVAVFDAVRNHKNLKPMGIAELNPEGKELARVLAEEISGQLDEIRGSSADQGGTRA